MEESLKSEYDRVVNIDDLNKYAEGYENTYKNKVKEKEKKKRKIWKLS